MKRTASGLSVLAFLIWVGLLYAAPTTIHIDTDWGRLRIQSDDAEVEVIVRRGGKEVKLRDLKSDREVTLKVAGSELEVVAGTNGLAVRAEKFTVTRGERKIFQVWLEQAAAVAKAKPAPPGSERLFNPDTGHDYQRIDVSMSWHDAKKYCENLGGHLATVTSSQENAFIYNHFGRDQVCWLGATDEAEEGVWQWVTGEPFVFQNWAPREPNNNRKTEHYLVLGHTQFIEKGVSYRSAFGGLGAVWNDKAAHGLHPRAGVPIAFPVCEWDEHDHTRAIRLAARDYRGGAIKPQKAQVMEEPSDRYAVSAAAAERLIKNVKSTSTKQTSGQAKASVHCLDDPLQPSLLNEDARAFVDRFHQYNGVSVSGLPKFLIGAEYIRNANNQKQAEDFVLQFDLTQQADLYLFIDNRVGDRNNRIDDSPDLGEGVMDWVLDMGFEDTGFDIGVDRSGERDGILMLGTGSGSSIDDLSSVFVLKNATPGHYRFLRQDKPKYRNMYGLAAVRKSGRLSRSPQDEPKVAIYYDVPIRDLKITEGKLLERTAPAQRQFWQRARFMHPYAVVDGGGEAFIFNDGNMPIRGFPPPGVVLERDRLVIRLPNRTAVSGRLYLPKPDWSGMVKVKFVVPANLAKAEARVTFMRAKLAHYQRNVDRRLPGGAWFRHQARQARGALHRGQTDRLAGTPRPTRFRENEFMRTYALFTGGRALSENLQLDRVLPGTQPEVETVDLASIEGITVREIDWSKLIADLEPQPDPLAALVPSDQHVVFFPSFDAVVKVADQVDQMGGTILSLAEPRSESANVFKQYEHQLGLSLDGVSRLLGPRVAGSIALTGSDPYFRTGTDVAILIETARPELLESLLWKQIQLAANATGRSETLVGQIGKLAYHAVRSPDRSICSYVTKLENAVVVTNSPYQLGRLASVQEGESPSVASLSEYTFFRSRYPRAADEESAFVFLSDATIRRWCGPHWRIATSRRTRQAAVIAELQASYFQRLVENAAEPGPIHTDLANARTDELALTAGGVISSIHGSLNFMTPIAELPMQRVTQAEASGYERWRDSYQRNWQWAFDPIGLRLSFTKDQTAADLTVMPLIAATQYRRFISISRGARIEPQSGDPHEALGHFILAINTDSPMVRQSSNFAAAMAPGAQIDPLSWLGDWISLYVDDDPLWQELAELSGDDLRKALPRTMGRLPIAIRADVSSGFKLTAFLAAVRAFIEQTAPDMTTWESFTYNDEPYVKISPTPRALRGQEELENVALYYAASGDSLIVTLNESVLKRALDRQITRNAAADQGKKVQPAGQPWLGLNVGMHAKRKLVDIVTKFNAEMYQITMQTRAWNNLPILNEWKRLYPDRDPVQLHEQIWQTRLICPGEGSYVWNDPWQTIESTVYGHPGQPRSGPAAPPVLKRFLSGNFGLTFEDQGLRARVSLSGAVSEK